MKKEKKAQTCAWCHKDGASDVHKDQDGRDVNFHPECFSEAIRVAATAAWKIGAPKVGQCGIMRVEKDIPPALCILGLGHKGPHLWNEASARGRRTTEDTANKLVQLPDGNWVNPAYVTAIELAKIFDETWTRVWVVKDGEYHTGNYCFKGDIRDALAKALGK